MTYDSKVYTFTVSVAIDGDNLVSTVKVEEEPVEELKAEFVNIYYYTPPIPPEDVLQVRKQVTHLI